MRKLPAVLLGLLLLAACSTIPYGQRSESIANVIDLLNKGDAATLAASSALPFMFNGETVELREDLGTMWSNIAKSGLKLTDTRILSSGPASTSDASYFGGSFEAKVFFEKHLPKHTAIVRIQSAEGTFDLLLDGARQGHPVIVGFAEEGQ